MASGPPYPVWLFGLGVVTAAVGLVYLLYMGLRQDHVTGDYHFTWGIGVVSLFLLGFAPGLVGIGLYATIERDFPIHYLFMSVLLAVLVVAVLGYSVSTASTATVGLL
ncbi:hypothetical protein [Halostella pelagica]|uniref:hypothetical protein n=1 Tax=Halostella pelagica TaxID=2583824 RepID=UPI001080FA3D|nr:hypothetical protein [Halostella pelagica]